MLFLSEDSRKSLLQLARLSVKEAVTKRQLPEKIPNDGIFAERRGVFVTLHVRGRLRGCIGVVEPDEFLGEAIVRCSVSAALQDPRFPALRPEELPDLQIELSLLSAPVPITSDAIEIGRHGLIVNLGDRRGLLLPQVAAEHKFTPQVFLEETCQKAGLSRDASRDPQLKIFAFTCDVFAEEPSRASH